MAVESSMTIAPLRAGVASASSPGLSALREFREGWFGCLFYSSNGVQGQEGQRGHACAAG
jgi:hypothetical protein